MKAIFTSQYDLLIRFFRLAIANVISNIMTPLANTLSVIFLGHLSEIHHLAGVALAGNVLSNLYILLGFLRMGTTGVTAIAVGQDDREAVVLVGLRNGMIALILGVVIILLQYPLGKFGFALFNTSPEIKASAIAYFNAQVWGSPAILLNFVLIGWFLGQEQNGLVVLLSFVGNAVNIALDYLFIVGWGWETTGAGLSVAISQYLALLIGLIFLCKHVHWKEVQSLAGEIWDASAIKSVFTLNGNIFVSYFVILIAFVIFDYQGAAMGKITYAENTLLLQVYILSNYFIEGLGFGTEILTGNFKGKGDNQQLVPLVVIAVVTSLLVGIGFGGASVLFPQTVFGLFTNHIEVIEHINIYVPWLLLVLVCASITWSLEGYFLGVAQGHTLRNASLAATVLGFAPTACVAFLLHSNHILWLALSLFTATRMVTLGLEFFGTFMIEADSPRTEATDMY
ncbi:MATE family efflux transporter [Aetokthonos hydrillicola Thurmond2011]|jgi:MATE family multidrug resistance protein|uniref:Probable multidrug resistance protein NorM n=2 Tax=Aetokthonos TaxID=1550243 RepID=A0AAP5MAQ9_9CYAN|nr:MATE family efflux transporter [Aetokthonos hydrillicola CCALA 1050]MBW4589416.1 MATE family efflux transporter [Aetokthonos hydrillicola CCALA 1050]MDR9897107.1 MATE family efflux transporter [Aetokthonos hydrillicola Thurmond2011]